MVGRDLASSVERPGGGCTSAWKLNASRFAGTSRNCLGRTLCESLSVRHEIANSSSARLKSDSTKAFQRNGREGWAWLRAWRIRILRTDSFNLLTSDGIRDDLKNRLRTLST